MSTRNICFIEKQEKDWYFLVEKRLVWSCDKIAVPVSEKLSFLHLVQLKNY